MYPYSKAHGIGELQFRFFNEEARSWYDPLKPYTLLEYEWVREHIVIEDQVVFDAGAHHGNYAVIFKGASIIACFEKERRFENYILENMKLNKISNYQVFIEDLSRSNRPCDLTPLYPDIYKMDIEGDEFAILPTEVSSNPQVHTWIIEIHPHAGDPDTIAKLLDGYQLLKVDREAMKVRPYVLGERWLSHATLIARKM